MTHDISSRLARLARWLFGSPFQELPPVYGNTVPPELLVFEAEAEEASRHGLGGIATPVPARHRRTHPARLDSWMERQ
jgi:hypothetical protein